MPRKKAPVEPLTTKILIEIRDDIRSTKHELSTRLDRLTDLVDAANTRTYGLAQVVREIRDELRRRDDDLEQRIRALEQKVS